MTLAKWLCSAFLFCLLLSPSLLAQDINSSPVNVGRAPYALMSRNFHCGDFLRSLKHVPEWHVSFLWNTFGSAHSCIEKIFKSKKLRSIHISLMNERCMWNKNCEQREILFGINPLRYLSMLTKDNFEFVMDLHSYQTHAADYILPRLKYGVKCYVSPALESSLGRKGAKNLLDITRSIWSNRCEVVWNPLPSNPNKYLNGADLIEYHTMTKAPNKYRCLAHLDGHSVQFDGEPKTKGISEHLLPSYVINNSHCEVIYLWGGEDNCATVGKFTPPTKRLCPSSTYSKFSKYLTLDY